MNKLVLTLLLIGTSGVSAAAGFLADRLIWMREANTSLEKFKQDHPIDSTYKEALEQAEKEKKEVAQEVKTETPVTPKKTTTKPKKTTTKPKETTTMPIQELKDITNDIDSPDYSNDEQYMVTLFFNERGPENPEEVPTVINNNIQYVEDTIKAYLDKGITCIYLYDSRKDCVYEIMYND